MTTEKEAAKETDPEILRRLGVDPYIWAQELHRTMVNGAEVDIGFLLAWFSNAIEAGRNAGSQWRAGDILEKVENYAAQAQDQTGYIHINDIMEICKGEEG